MLALVGTPTLLGVARGNTHQGRRATTAGGRIAAAAPRPQPAAFNGGGVPFTRLDVVLLVTGGAMLVGLGSAVGRVRDDRFAVEDVDGDA